MDTTTILNRTNVFDYVKAEELDYRTKKITLGENWNWNMSEHINTSFLMKHSKYSKGNNDLGNRPYKNIVRPILNVAYRNEGFDVKDIEPFVDDMDYTHLSLLVRKFHPNWALENHMDTFIDELVESYVDYGGVLVKSVNDIRPEVVPLQRLAFVDQRDILSGAICEKHSYSVDQLLDMKGRWKADKIDEVITLSRMAKPNSTSTGEERANSKAIEVYELHGMFPETWLDPDGNPDIYSKQIHIITYYKSQETQKNVGIALFGGKESKEVYKFLARDGIFNRALGFGGIEELFEPQVWTNYDIIQIKEMLDVASLMILNTQDPTFAQKNKVSDLSKGEITYSTQPLTQVNIQPINMNQFVNSLVQWEQSARTTGSASDPALGLEPVSGTPLGTTQIVTQQGQGIHAYRQGKIATFVSEIYRDWVLKFLVDEMNKGQKYQEELSLDELQEVAEKVINCVANDRIKQMVLSGKMVTQEEIDTFKEIKKQEFMKGGTRRFFEAMKDELKDLPVKVRINVANKQKDLNRDAGKFAEIFKAILVNPQNFIQAMQIPEVAGVFNQALEYAGMREINFTSTPKSFAPPQGGQPVAPALATPA